MMFLTRSIYTSMLTVVLLSNGELYAAADDKKEFLASLTDKVVYFYQSKTLYEKEVTYWHNDAQVGSIYYSAGVKIHDGGGSIDRLVVEHAYRLQGVGSNILKRALQDLKDNGYGEVWVEPQPFEAACKDYTRERKKLITFYEKNGFKVFNDTSYISISLVMRIVL